MPLSAICRGALPFFARTYAPITELKEYAPEMELLDMDTANLEAEATLQLVILLDYKTRGSP